MTAPFTCSFECCAPRSPAPVNHNFYTLPEAWAIRLVPQHIDDFAPVDSLAFRSLSRWVRDLWDCGVVGPVVFLKSGPHTDDLQPRQKARGVVGQGPVRHAAAPGGQI